MSMFKKFNTEGHAEATDQLGGGSYAVESDAYDGTIKLAYAGKSPSSDAQNVTFVVDLGNGKELRETIYISDAQGNNFYYPKKDGKPDPTQGKKTLPGYELVDSICIMTTDAELADQETEDKMVKVWDKDARAEVPKSVPVLTALIGQKVTLGVLRVIETVMEKDSNGKYTIPTEKERTSNTIDKAFEIESKLTIAEARQGREEAIFFESWVSRNKGKDRDKRVKAGAAGGKAGAPRAMNRPAGQAPQAGAAPAKTGGLFGKK